MEDLLKTYNVRRDASQPSVQAAPIEAVNESTVSLRDESGETHVIDTGAELLHHPRTGLIYVRPGDYLVLHSDGSLAVAQQGPFDAGYVLS